ncbi:MAG: cadherin-like domain-containing protein [Hyphomicrobiaceae bacterium]
MSKASRATVIGRELTILGEVRNGNNVEVFGAVHGKVDGRHVVIQPGGEIIGELRAQSAEVHGQLQGIVRVRDHIAIRNHGSVQGDVYYGSLSLEPGGDLDARVSNVPPHLSGDFELLVRLGSSVRITRNDLTAIDPDDTATDLVYEVSNVSHGHLAHYSAPQTPVTTFTQADINKGDVVFVHTGDTLAAAGFDATVRDSAGNTSGEARHVTVAVVAS